MLCIVGEWISGATCMYIVDYFVQNYKKEAIITNLMDNLEFVLVPFVNPDGYVVGVVKTGHVTFSLYAL